MWTKLNSLTSNLAILNSISHRGFQFGTWGPRSWNSETRSFGRLSSTFVPWPWCLRALSPRPETCSLAILSLPAIIFFFWRGEHRLTKLGIYWSVWMARKFIGDETNRGERLGLALGSWPGGERDVGIWCVPFARGARGMQRKAPLRFATREWVRLRDFEFWGIYICLSIQLRRDSQCELILVVKVYWLY